MDCRRFSHTFWCSRNRHLVSESRYESIVWQVKINSIFFVWLCKLFYRCSNTSMSGEILSYSNSWAKCCSMVRFFKFVRSSFRLVGCCKKCCENIHKSSDWGAHQKGCSLHWQSSQPLSRNRRACRQRPSSPKLAGCEKPKEEMTQKLGVAKEEVQRSPAGFGI